MRPNVSILVGSGFSIPERIPGVGQLNQRLSKIDESEILIHSSQKAIFLNGNEDRNRWSRQVERFFVQEFLEFYNNEVLKDDEEFHYEIFYDYYSGYLTNQENEEAIEDFYTRFIRKHYSEKDNYSDCYNFISDFNRTFNQLLATLLHKRKYFNDEIIKNHMGYDTFIGFLKELLKTCDVKFHSLNHDLFFDYLGHKHFDLWELFADGYQLAGSPFYGFVNCAFDACTQEKVIKNYLIKLEHFTNKFDKPLSLFKLHGSISNRIVYKPQPNQESFRIKDNFKVSQFYMESTATKSGNQVLEPLHDEVVPDFLSGTTNKTKFYSDDPYYKNLFMHLENNLLSSELLVVIGYGFQDVGINEYIEKNYLLRNKHMVVIDPCKPKTDLIEKFKATHIPKGVTQVTFQEFINQIPKVLW